MVPFYQLLLPRLQNRALHVPRSSRLLPLGVSFQVHDTAGGCPLGEWFDVYNYGCIQTMWNALVVLLVFRMVLWDNGNSETR